MKKITTQQIEEAAKNMQEVVWKTPLQFSKRLSKKYDAKVYIKREDLQEVRSFKIRGAFNKMSSLTDEEKAQGVVTASTGNHAQGVALSCYLLKIHGVIFMPNTTPLQKIEKVKHFGDGFIEIKLIGQTFDDAYQASKKYCEEEHASYVHPFDDLKTIIGQGTIGLEIYKELGEKIDVVISPVGGGGLAAGIASYVKQKKQVAVFGVEAQGAAGMHKSFQKGYAVSLGELDTFVDGAAVSTVGNISYELCKQYLEKIVVVPEGLVCSVMIELYQNEGIVAEPAGALSVSALEELKDVIKRKTVVCILSGGNNDILRYPEVLERSLVWQGKKHYFLIEFAQKPGQLKGFLDKAMGPTDDIVRFEYMKKTNKERGTALVGIELTKKEDLQPLLNKMKEIELNFRMISSDEMLYSYLI